MSHEESKSPTPTNDIKDTGNGEGIIKAYKTCILIDLAHLKTSFHYANIPLNSTLRVATKYTRRLIKSN